MNSSTGDAISVDSVTKSFGQGDKKITVLKNLSLNLKEGLTSAILGRSGSGKSTLLSLLAGLDQPDTGKVSVAGQSLTQMSESELTDFRSRSIGIIFQHFHLLPHLSATENISLALEISKKGIHQREALEKAQVILEQVGLSERQDHFPSMLSGGEKQRVAIARALVVEPEVLLADEPSGSLDEKTGQEIMKLIFDLVKLKKTTLILVTHDRELAGECDQKWELDRGQLC